MILNGLVTWGLQTSLKGNVGKGAPKRCSKKENICKFLGLLAMAWRVGRYEWGSTTNYRKNKAKTSIVLVESVFRKIQYIAYPYPVPKKCKNA